MTQEEQYIELKLSGCIDSKELLSAKFNNEEIKGTIGEFVREKLRLDVHQYEKFQEKHDPDIQYVKSLFNSENRKEGFKNIYAFYKWYMSQDKVCCYCGVKEEDLKKYFHKDNEQYQSARQRGKRLEIERVVTAPKEKNVYSASNCKLACYICNNAKSDFISAKDFKSIAKGINTFWNEILKNSEKKAEFPETSDIWAL